MSDQNNIDTLEHVGNSVLHHGPLNRRIYVSKLDYNDRYTVSTRIEQLCTDAMYEKVIIKTSSKTCAYLINDGYTIEADIPNFYNGQENGVFLTRYLSEERKKNSEYETINHYLTLSQKKRVLTNVPTLPEHFTMRLMTLDDTLEMVKLYKSVFKSYPFPIFDNAYLQKTIRENVEYAGIFFKDQLVSLASAEKAHEFLNAEMTDFATLHEFRGNNFALILLDFLEKKMHTQDYKVLYTIARSLSPGMNMTFRKKGYSYAGTLINNTNISGKIESMNIWYKNIELNNLFT